MWRSGLFVVLMSMFAAALFIEAGVCRVEWEVQESGVTESGVTERIWDMSFIDEYHGWAVGENSTIIHTDDGGETWVKQECPVEGVKITDLFFVDSMNGYCAGITTDLQRGAFLFASSDGGETWTIRYDFDGIAIGVNDIYFLDENTGIFLSRTDTILKTEDAGHTW